MSRYDFAVIGGGMAGVSAAARLAELGSVVVLEREDTLGFHYGNKYILAMTRPGLAGFEAPLGCEESVLSPRGVLMVATTDEMASHGGDVLGGTPGRRRILMWIGCCRALPVRRAGRGLSLFKRLR